MTRTMRDSRFPHTAILHAAALAVVSVAIALNSSNTEGAERVSAGQILDAAGVKGGLIVHLGCGDGKLTAALKANDRCIVQALDTDRRSVEKARRYLRSLGLYGKVSAGAFDGCRLPYVDGLVNLLVVSLRFDVTDAEIQRVLAPGGVAVVASGGMLEKPIRKPWPEQMDEWTHFLHDASGNAVSKDTLVGPPRRLQWSAGPRWARSHEHGASLTTMVSGEGKVFYFYDEGIRGIIVRDLPERWALYARDAFSGVLLWKKRFSDWGNSVWDGVWHCREPMTVPRRLVVVGGKVYATLGFREAAVTVLDPDTGKVLDGYQTGKNNDELVWHDGVLLIRQRKSIPDYPVGPGSSKLVVAKARRGKTPEMPPASMGDETILALDTDTGKELWRLPEKRVVALSLAALGRRVCYHNLNQIVCLDLRSGAELWRADCPTWPDITGTGGTLVMYGDKVVHAGDRGVKTFSAATGKLIWQGPGFHRMSPRHPADMLVVNDLIWGGPTPRNSGNPAYAEMDKTPFSGPLVGAKDVQGRDINTGEVARSLDIGSLVSPGHHVRCYRSKATERFLLWPKRGIEFVDIAEGTNHERVDWARGECGYGVMPSGGLVYIPPHPCICYVGVTLDGFNALAPARDRTSSIAPKPVGRLEKGPAYGGDVHVPAPAENAGEAWPMYRHDPVRTGRATCSVAARVTKRWTADIGGRLTQPVVADGKAYVSSIDGHAIHGFQADHGTELWRFTADARVDSPPTIHGDLLLFGCSDGMVYCLRTSDGALVWRRQAAPREARCVVRSQLESRWPVHGSVLVQNGVAYVLAGRSSFLDGGMFLYGLDPESGKVLYEARLNGPWLNSRADSSEPYYMEGAKSDVLTGDGERVFLGFHEFDRRLKLLPAEPFATRGSRKGRLRLMSTTGLLDDSWFDRGRWTYSTRWPGQDWREDTLYTGQILSFDESTVYVLNAFPSRGLMSSRFIPGKRGYSLAAHRYDPEDPHDPGTMWDKVRNTAKEKDLVRWQRHIPIRARGMVLAGDLLFLAGVPDVIPEDDPYAALEGRRGAELWAVDTGSGKTQARHKLGAPSVFDGMIAAEKRLYLSTADGRLACYGPTRE